MDQALIERLARLRGIGDAYHDYRGELRHFSQETKAGILSAMGSAVDDDDALTAEIARAEAAHWHKLLPAVATAHGARIAFDINIAAREFGAAIVWRALLEDGSRLDGAVSSADCAEVWRGEVAGSWITRRRFELAVDLPPGYHELEAKIAGSAPDHCFLIVSPPRCFEPAAIAAGRRLWGVAVQLYTLRSAVNWGVGDFHDLEMLIRWTAAFGAGFIGLNPLHALAPADPLRSSPYSASSRHFLNVLYISVPRVPEFEQCLAARARIADPQFANRLRAQRARQLVDYRGVADLKFEILALLHQDFRDKHLALRSERGRGFLDFVARRGRPLQLHARFDALDRHFRAAHGSASGWMSWPQEYRDVNGSAAARFALEHPVEVEFFAYLQWLAHEQLLQAQALTWELGMPIGLYGDYAVGANPSGSETWTDEASYCLGAEIGAPPDPLALKGQGWGIPPPNPAVLQSQRLSRDAHRAGRWRERRHVTLLWTSSCGTITNPTSASATFSCGATTGTCTYSPVELDGTGLDGGSVGQVCTGVAFTTASEEALHASRSVPSRPTAPRHPRSARCPHASRTDARSITRVPGDKLFRQQWHHLRRRRQLRRRRVRRRPGRHRHGADRGANRGSVRRSVQHRRDSQVDDRAAYGS